MNVWICGWIVSSLSAYIAFKSFKKSGLSSSIAIITSTLFFFSPLMILMKSGNSVIYLFDLAIIPVSYFFFSGKYTMSLKYYPAWMVILSAGLWPFINSFFYAATSTRRRSTSARRPSIATCGTGLSRPLSPLLSN